MVVPLFFSPRQKEYFVVDHDVKCTHCQKTCSDDGKVVVIKITHSMSGNVLDVSCLNCLTITDKIHIKVLQMFFAQLCTKEELPADAIPIIQATWKNSRYCDLTIQTGLPIGEIPNGGVTIDRTRYAGRETYEGYQIVSYKDNTRTLTSENEVFGYLDELSHMEIVEPEETKLLGDTRKKE